MNGKTRIAIPDAIVVLPLASVSSALERARERKDGYKFEIPNPTTARATRRRITVGAWQ